MSFIILLVLVVGILSVISPRVWALVKQLSIWVLKIILVAILLKVAAIILGMNGFVVIGGLGSLLPVPAYLLLSVGLITLVSKKPYT